MAERTETPRHASILLVDPDAIVRDSLGDFLTGEGYEVAAADRVSGAIDRLSGAQFDLVICDVSLPDRDGMELLRHVREYHRDVPVVLVTDYGTIESAVQAIKLGACDYLTKPVIEDDVRRVIERALAQRQLEAENRRLRQAIGERYSFSQIVGQDYRMSAVFDLMEAVADSRTTVLITGESGTGKSLIARAIHTHSQRRDRPFVEVACGALPDTLLESELFGHVRGAFTHAVGDKPGKFAAADGGTVFLDEIATASPQLQVKLLRVLQERWFEPVGSNETRHVDVRVILASNHDLWQEVQAGRFRQDLYYRVNVVNIDLPPLRDRLGDIPLLAEHFLRKYVAQSSKRISGFSADATAAMQRYAWPGNVRELENCVERAVVLSRGSVIGDDDLPPVVRNEEDAGGLTAAAAGRTLKEALASPERRIIAAALRENKGSRQATAEQLGINRTTLYKKMKRYGLDGP